MSRSSTRYQAILLIGVLISFLSIIPAAFSETLFLNVKRVEPTAASLNVLSGATFSVTFSISNDNTADDKDRTMSGTYQLIYSGLTLLSGPPTSGTFSGLAKGTPIYFTWTFQAPTGPATGEIILNAQVTSISPSRTFPTGGDQVSDSKSYTVQVLPPPSVDTSLVLSIAPSSVVVGSSGPVVFTATLTRTDTGAGVAGATISFTVDGTVVGSAITGATGVATLNYNPSALTPGSHTVQASFAGQTIGGITFNPSTSNTQTLQVIYNFIGFLPPLGSGTFKAGSTIPAKFQLTDYYGNYISDAKAQIWVDSNPGTSSGSSNNENYFRYDSTNNQYIFNLSTKGMSPGTYTITVTLDDGKAYSTTITLK
ncbi:MAG: Ig-like domain repeat protein [Thaumarchaeota archaeon]|nr:Ig-like domain repeat protein [Nitrososphaerota archaeon]